MNLFKKYNISNVTGITSALSNDMADHVELWNQMLNHSAEWYGEVSPSGVIEAIAGALSNPVAEEVDVTAKNEALHAVMKHLNEHSTELVNNLVLCGASLIRPTYNADKLQYEIVRLGNYIPTSYDFDGTLTGAVICKQFDDKNKHYLLLEVHEYKNRTHKVHMELYEIIGESTLKRRGLEACPQTMSLTEFYKWDEVEHPMIIEVRNRKPNNIDSSNTPCAIYSGVENLVKDADTQYDRMNWEQESAKRIVFADEDLFTKKKVEGKLKLGERLRKMFVNIQGNGIGDEKLETFSPDIRSDGQIAAFNQILRRLELACNIGKGTLSDMEAVSQTATQYTGGKKALYTVVDSIESELEQKYKHCAYVFAYMLSAYTGISFDDKIEITFNDTLRKDPVQMKQEAREEINTGILNPWEYRMKFFNEDEELAKLNTPEKSFDNFTMGM